MNYFPFGSNNRIDTLLYTRNPTTYFNLQFYMYEFMKSFPGQMRSREKIHRFAAYELSSLASLMDGPTRQKIRSFTIYIPQKLITIKNKTNVQR